MLLRMLRGVGALVALSVLAGLTVGCAPVRGSMLRLSGPAMPCRVPVSPPESLLLEQIRWIAPSPAEQRAKLDAWCGTAGPPVIADRQASIIPGASPVTRPVAHAPSNDELVVITWNVHAGTGDVAELVRRLRAGDVTGHPSPHFVLLLQEAMRAGAIVPRVVQPGARPPKAAGLGTTQADIVELAAQLGLSLYYVPSMRNGAPAKTDQDRGNAILSSEPLRDFAAIELPFERQRRVAIYASVSGRSRSGHPWTLRMVSAHLESTVPASRLWILANGARVRQAQGLMAALDPTAALVLSGDFNTWMGFADPAYRAIDGTIPGIAATDRRATYRPFFRLDHMFARLPDGWTVETRRLDDRLHSDHFPIMAVLRDRPTAGVMRTE